MEQGGAELVFFFFFMQRDDIVYDYTTLLKLAAINLHVTKYLPVATLCEGILRSASP
jgi:hypothetical protein